MKIKTIVTILLLLVTTLTFAQKFPKPDKDPYKVKFTFSKSYEDKLGSQKDGTYLLTYLKEADIYYYFVNDSIGFYDSELIMEGVMVAHRTDRIKWWINEDKNMVFEAGFGDEAIRRVWVPAGNLRFISDDNDVYIELVKTKRK